MKKRKNVQHRDLLGAFLGGMLGILMVGYFHLTLLPLGCLFGVVIGWWHKEIFRFTRIVGRRKMRNSFASAESLANNTVYIVKGVGGCLLRTIALPFRLVGWIFRILSWPVRWPLEHPTNAAWTASLFIVYPLYIACNFPIVLISWQYVPVVTTAISFILAILVPCIAFFSHVDTGEENYREKTKFFYGMWERWSRSKLGYILNETRRLLAIELVLVIAGVSQTIWWWVVGLGFFTIIILPVFLGITAARAMFRLITKEEHWLCFGTTLVATLSSALAFGKWFTDPHILWSVAIFTGACAGVVMLPVRKAAEKWASDRPHIPTTLNVPISKRLELTTWRFSENKQKYDAWFQNLALPFLKIAEFVP